MAAHALENAPKVVLTLDSKDVLLNDVPSLIEIPPVLVEGTTFLPIRFVAEEILDAEISWDSTTKTIALVKHEVNIKLSLETGQASVNDRVIEIDSPPFIKDGRTLVPLRFLAENLDMLVEFDPTEKTITITQAMPEPVNLPPVITSLGLQSNVIKMGAAPGYNYTYVNEEEEGIIAEEWSYQRAGDARAITGKPRAFFRPGKYILYLKIKDNAGNWSETASTSFTVSEEKLMTEMAFKFSNPVYGEMFENDDNVNFNLYESNENISFKRSGPVLHLSNSPEVVARPGILYQNEASGKFRLMYHHLNGASEKQRLYIIAGNNGFNPVTLQTLQSGAGGPVSDYMNLGQLTAMRYLPSQPSNIITIQPGKKVILNPGQRFLKNKEAVTGMQDFEADGTITISVVMGPEKAPEQEPEPKQIPVQVPKESPTQEAPTVIFPEDLPNIEPVGEINADGEPVPEKTPEEIQQEKIEYLLSLPVLPRTSPQVRGVFPDGDCLVDIRVNEGSKEKIILGMETPGFDAWVEGVDPLTGETVKNVGNYGVVYHIKMSSPVQTGVLLNPRGSIFKGAYLGSDRMVYKIPQTSYFTGLQKAAVWDVLETGKTAEFIYTPPSGSDTPLVIAFIPEEFWD
ncbi:MAG: stalk domain-containing protein [Firmicutes bacterium]|nr:stalk domain-containing protein [Bacillota bacterium]